MSLTDQELVARLTLTEDSFVERKSASDKGGWLQTAVAFANAPPIGYPAVLFLGVENDGAITGIRDPEAVMKSFSDFINERAYPAIYTEQRIVTKDDKVRILLDSRAKRVAHEQLRMKGTAHAHSSKSYFILQDCNQFFVTLKSEGADVYIRSLPLESLQIAQDEKDGCLKIITEA